MRILLCKTTIKWKQKEQNKTFKIGNYQRNKVEYDLYINKIIRKL